MAVEAFLAEDVFLRDGWTCALCAGPIEPLTEGGLAPSLDHRVPIERGGGHAFENAQAAHLACNLWKGLRTMDEIAALVPIYSEVSPAWPPERVSLALDRPADAAGVHLTVRQSYELRRRIRADRELLGASG